MPLTVDELKLLDLGYLTGADLLQHCSPQLLISRYEVDNSVFSAATARAISYTIGLINTRYDLTSEFNKKGNSVSDLRSSTLVEIVSKLAVRRILGNLTNISEELRTSLNEGREDLTAIRNGQMNLPLKQAGNTAISTASLISSSFLTVG